MPPLHPALVHFPIALSVTSVVTDSLNILLALPQLSSVGQWTVALSAAGAMVAAVAGERDMRLDRLSAATHAIVHLHRTLGWSVVANLLLLAAARWAVDGPGPIYLIYGWFVILLVLAQGWLGGELVYAHGAGVAAAGQGQEPASEAQQPTLRLYRRLTRADPVAPDASAHHRGSSPRDMVD